MLANHFVALASDEIKSGGAVTRTGTKAHRENLNVEGLVEAHRGKFTGEGIGKQKHTKTFEA